MHKHVLITIIAKNIVDPSAQIREKAACLLAKLSPCSPEFFTSFEMTEVLEKLRADFYASRALSHQRQLIGHLSVVSSHYPEEVKTVFWSKICENFTAFYSQLEEEDVEMDT